MSQLGKITLQNCQIEQYLVGNESLGRTTTTQANEKDHEHLIEG
jgi:hypothetical protein